MDVQLTDWGKIIWLNKEEDVFPKLKMNIGVVTINQGAYQPSHVHYEEQIIYILDGNGYSYINNKYIKLKQGKMFHLPAGVIHEVYNSDEKPLRHLLISNPVDLDKEDIIKVVKDKENSDARSEDNSDLIFNAVESLETNLLESIHYSYSIFDNKGNLVSRSKYFPNYCSNKCDMNLIYKECNLLERFTIKQFKKEQIIRCPNDIMILSIPIFYRNKFLGYIQGGYIKYSDSKTNKNEDIYDTPKSSFIGIKNLLKTIVKAIIHFCEIEQLRKEIVFKERQILNTIESHEILAKDLQDKEFAMTDLKINNHFLFNTLNSMASMALEEGSISMYRSIIDLSNMFHYTLRTKEMETTLEKELKYVDSYLKLQKLRYKDNLDINYNIDKDIKNLKVPFNFLQPIIENAFVHGFNLDNRKKIDIYIKRFKSRLDITIFNSGKILDEKSCDFINKEMKKNTNHGLSMIYNKLLLSYKNDFSLKIVSDNIKGTRFQISIPIDYQKYYLV